MNRHLVFVYGSLLNGLHNHRVLAGAEFVGEGVLTDPCVMLDLGHYPALVRDDDAGGETPGEVYSVDDAGLKRLDQLEGHPQYYARVLGTAVVSGQKFGVSYYVLPPGGRDCPLVQGNDWRRHLTDAKVTKLPAGRSAR